MNSVLLALIGIVTMILGYILYSRYLARRLYVLDDNRPTPAHTMQDGVDYVPTNKYVLWGHHFTSVAGAAPIVGPAIGVIWGWLPAFLWVTVGTVFFAGMHDMGALWASTRNKGHSIGTLSGHYVGRHGRNLFMVVIFLLLLMVNAAFAVVIGNLLIDAPGAVIPTWGALVVAVLVGQAIYRWKLHLVAVSVIGVVALYGLIIIGDRFPIVLPDPILGLSPNAFWVVLLYVYAAFASVLPVWVLLQPRDYINGLQLFVGLGLLFGSIFIAAPEVVAPAWNSAVPADTPGLVPLLFVTIACGAISGFHGIVASGTSSKQLNKESDARFVGYFGAVGEGLLALGAIIATTAGFQTVADWEAIYSSFAGGGGVNAFVQGGGSILNAGLAIPQSLSATILATMAVLFAATTMDTGIRLQRYVVQEAAELAGTKVGTDKFVSTFVVVAAGLGLAFGAGANGSGGMIIWPLFGTTNQLMAALTLSILAVILVRARRPVFPIMVPMVFISIMTIYALFVQLGGFWRTRNWLLLIMDVIVLIAAIWVMFEAFIAINNARKGVAEAPEEPEDRAGEQQYEVPWN